MVTPQATQIPAYDSTVTSSGSGFTSTSMDQSASSGEGLDSFTMSWLNKFNADLQAMLRGSAPSGSGTRTVSGQAGPPPSANPVTSFTDKRVKNFSESLSTYLKDGGTGNVFYNPVMHYDLNSMKDRFTAVNETAGIYERDGVLYATRDLNGSTVLQPVGIHGQHVNGFSDDLSEEQKAFFDKLLEAKNKMKDEKNLSPDEAKAKLMEIVRDPAALQKFMETYGPKESEGGPEKAGKNNAAGTHPKQ